MFLVFAWFWGKPTIVGPLPHSTTRAFVSKLLLFKFHHLRLQLEATHSERGSCHHQVKPNKERTPTYEQWRWAKKSSSFYVSLMLLKFNAAQILTLKFCRFKSLLSLSKWTVSVHVPCWTGTVLVSLKEVMSVHLGNDSPDIEEQLYKQNPWRRRYQMSLGRHPSYHIKGKWKTRISVMMMINTSAR